MSRKNQSGVALLFVLSVIMIVVILGNLVLNFVLSQSRLSHHQVSRIRAYYAATAGMNLAYEKFRLGEWDSNPGSITGYCINGQVALSGQACAETVTDTDIPYNVQILVYPQSSSQFSGSRDVKIFVSY
ncbi:MAG: hypothetical protein WCY12_01545 [Candidatus Omnitrophota bacterium]|jgi:Tfp pilus assembly protein PilX